MSSAGDQRIQRLKDLFHGIVRTLRSFVRGQILIASILTLCYAAGFYWIGVPLWFLAALLCGVMHLVPMIGVAMAILIPVSFELFGGGDLWAVLQILVWFGAVQALESLYLTPKILGRELKLHPLLVFLAVLFGAVAFGVLGALLAPPLVAVGLLIWREVRRQPRD